MCCCYFIIYYCLLYYFGEQSFEIDFSIKGEYAHGVVCQWPRSHTKFKASTVVHQIQFFRGFNLINKRFLKISTMSAKTNMIAFWFISHLPINSELISLVRRYDHITASLALQSDFFLDTRGKCWRLGSKIWFLFGTDRIITQAGKWGSLIIFKLE